MLVKIYNVLLKVPLAKLAVLVLFSGSKRPWVARYIKPDGSSCANLGDLSESAKLIVSGSSIDSVLDERKKILYKSLAIDNTLRSFSSNFIGSSGKVVQVNYYVMSSRSRKIVKNKGFIVLCFGACTAIESKYRDLDFLCKATGKSIVGFNYPKSPGVVATDDLVATALSVIDGVKENYTADYADIIAWGFCIGSWVSYQCYKKRPLKAVVLDHSPISITSALFSIDLCQYKAVKSLIGFYWRGLNCFASLLLKFLAGFVVFPAVLLQLVAYPVIYVLLKLAAWDIGCHYNTINNEDGVSLFEVKSRSNHPIGHCLKLYDRYAVDVSAMIDKVDSGKCKVAVVSHEKDGFLDHGLFPGGLYHKLFKCKSFCGATDQVVEVFE